MKLCEHCGQKPVKERTDRVVRFCSRLCANQSFRVNFPKPCKHCGETFQPPRNHRWQKFCSTDCRDAARRTQVLVSCDNCGKPVRVKPNRLKRLEHHFCNISCRHEWLRHNAPKGREHHQYNRVSIACELCGQIFDRTPSHISPHNFCGVLCREEWQRTSGYTAGKNSPTWLGGHIDHRGPNWDQQAEIARQRDGYTCQRCATTQAEYAHTLDVHHIIPWREFDYDWQKANHVDNLITYCSSCHQIIEWQTGAKAFLSSLNRQSHSAVSQATNPS